MEALALTKLDREVAAVLGLPLAQYSQSIAAAWLVEERVATLKLEYAYSHALLEEVTKSKRGPITTTFYWLLAHATPEQRCRAALSAVRASTKEAK